VDHRNSRAADFSSYPVKLRACAGAGVNVQGVNKIMSGTSMSAPLISRIVACLLSKNKGTIKQVENALFAGSALRGNTRTRVGHGVADGPNALDRLGGL
jgi:subtilisin family serine protease